MMKKRGLLLLILLFALLTRLYRLAIPDKYYFDEVYHAVTAKAYAVNNPAGYEWWHKAPEPGTAYEWLHPPLAKLFMAGGIRLFGSSAWAWRFPGVLFGVGVIWLTYEIGKLITKKESVGLLAAGLASLDGLLLAQSRIGMNDIYVTFFILAAVLCYVKAYPDKKRWLWVAGIMTGLAISTKWSGIFVWIMVGLWDMWRWSKDGRKWWRRVPRLIAVFILLPAVIYILSYSQFWIQGHSVSQFYELHQQIWWYQTNLKATHSYQSKAWEWPLMIRPVWYYVDYQDNRVGNIYNMGNPLIMWLGLAAQLMLVIDLVGKVFKRKLKFEPELVLPIGFFASWTPWLFSPRIMFFYHYTPAIPFLALALANKSDKAWKAGTVVLCAGLMFLWLWPLWTGIPLSHTSSQWRFLLPSWK